MNLFRRSLNDISNQLGNLYTFDNPYKNLYVSPSIIVRDGALYGHMNLEKDVTNATKN